MEKIRLLEVWRLEMSVISTPANVLEQFERLMKLIKFKRGYEGHAIEICVDNATTHSSRDYSLHDFGKDIGTRCPVQFIEWIDENNKKMKLNCYFTDGEHNGLSKGLLVLAQERGLRLPNNCKLNELKEILSRHDAFKNVSLVLQCFSRFQINSSLSLF